MIMTITVISEELKQLLEQQNYNPKTIVIYEREWRKIGEFLEKRYGDLDFDMERGLAYLEEKYNFQTNYDNGTLSQQRVQLLRVVHMLEDYRLHKVLTRRYYASRNPISLTSFFSQVHEKYIGFLSKTALSQSTTAHYVSISKEFLDYLQQKKIPVIECLTLDLCNGFVKTFAGYSFKTVEQKVCGMRHFLRFLNTEGYLTNDYASEFHMPPISKSAKIPSAWSVDELRRLLEQIDRNSPIGKRDYAMILLACILGIRIGDIKLLRFGNFDWNKKELSFVQHKTHKELKISLPDAVGWAVIDYIKNGRPKYYETDIVFLKHMPPFDPLGDNDHLQQLIVRYMNKAGIRRDKNKHSGFHSLRHSAASMLLDMDTPLPVISSILGHSDIDITGIYLKTDLENLKSCTLSCD